MADKKKYAPRTPRRAIDKQKTDDEFEKLFKKLSARYLDVTKGSVTEREMRTFLRTAPRTKSNLNWAESNVSKKGEGRLQVGQVWKDLLKQSRRTTTSESYLCKRL
jgi:hypothetical protein